MSAQRSHDGGRMLVPETEIIVSQDGVALFRQTVQPGDYVIGCAADCDVRIEAGQVSRRHAQLTVNFDHALIEDLGSSNGTFVNRQPVNEPTRLWPNQRIQIGLATIELRRVKTLPPADVSLDPSSATVQRLLPEELLRTRKYDIGGVVAEGGMGAILDAQEAAIDRKVAMKVMLSQGNAHSVQRFIEEAQVTAQLEHPNIVPVHELGVDANEQVFYTMKFVRGDTLREVLDRLAGGHARTVEKYPLPVLLTVFQKICDALAFAHSRGVIHRDLKPANIMLGDFGEVLVMDWGLAKRLGREPGAERRRAEPPLAEAEEPTFVTQDGAVLGTPQYMAPEQAQGEVNALDARTDIYSLGAILYHLLALRPAVTGRTAREVVDKVARGELENLERRGGPALPHLPEGRIPGSLAAVTRQAMAFDPDARYQTVAELQADLAAYQSGFATSAENASAWTQLTLLARRHRIIATVAGTSLLLLAAVSGFYIVGLRHALGRTEQARALASAATVSASEALAAAEAAQARAEAAQKQTDAALIQATADRKRADDRAADVEAQRAVAAAAFDRLRKSAPEFFERAQSLRQQQKFEDALTKLQDALSLEPDKPEYLLAQAHILQATEQLGPAAEIYEKVLTLPAGAADRQSARENRDLCREILRAPGGEGGLSFASRGKLIAAMVSQHRDGDAVLLDKKTEGGRKLAHVEIKSRLSPLVNSLLKSQVNFSWEQRLIPLRNNSFKLDLSNLQISQVPDLTGLPITELWLDGNQALTSLAPLKGSRLETLSANRTPIADLSPLAGLPLTDLRLVKTNVVDLTPLSGLPLKRLSVSQTPVANLGPLQGTPLESLEIDATQVQDLSVVRKLPLKKLSLLNLGRSIELSPLTECRTLETLAIPKTDADLLGIRSLPNLRWLIDPSLPRYLKPEEYWQQRPVNTREQAHLDKAMADLQATASGFGSKPQGVWNVQGLLLMNLRDTRVTDLQALRGLPIAVLDLFGEAVTDFSPLAETPVRRLVVGGRLTNSAPADFKTLKKVTTLTELTVGDAPLRNLEDLAGLSLKMLHIPNTDVTDLSPLQNTVIEDLNFRGTQILDVNPLLKMRWLRTVQGSKTVINAAILKKNPDLIYADDDKNAKPANAGGAKRP